MYVCTIRYILGHNSSNLQEEKKNNKEHTSNVTKRDKKSVQTEGGAFEVLTNFRRF